VTTPGVSAPRTDFADPVEPVRVALAQEERVTDQIKALAQLARAEGDLVGEQFLAWFLKEQLEEMSSMADLLRTVERAAETNILLAEDYLARTAVGDGGVEPDQPAAAGGAL
jgi:ferritin